LNEETFVDSTRVKIAKLKEDFSFRSFYGVLYFLGVGTLADCYVVARVVRKVEMTRNVWKHLFLLFP